MKVTKKELTRLIEGIINKKLLLEASSLSNIGATNQQIKSLYDKTESINWNSFTLKANAKFKKVKNKKDLITGADSVVSVMFDINNN